MSHNIKKRSVVIFAFGFMGKYTLKSFQKNNKFLVKGIILPKTNNLYYSNVNLKKFKKNYVLSTDEKYKIHQFIKKINPDLVIISTFSKILNPNTLKLSNFINIHHGKLPKQKGRAGINWAILMGRDRIYITIHQAIPKLDSGKILLQKKIMINKKDNYYTIKKKIGNFIEKNISKLSNKFLEKKINLKSNLSKNDTWNCSRNSEDSLINFFDKKEHIINQIRACYSLKFGAFCYLKNKKIIILDASINNKKRFEGIIPGRIVKVNINGSVDCLCADGVINIKKIAYKNKIIKPSKIIKSTRNTLIND